MATDILILILSSVNEEYIDFIIQNEIEQVFIKYYKNNESFSFDNQSKLSEIILENQFQLKKIIYSAIKGNLQPGQPVHFAFINNFPFIDNLSFNHYIQVDRRNNNLDVKVRKKGSKNIYKIFADGSYSQNSGQSGYAGIIEDKSGNKQLFKASSSFKSSNLMELLAIIQGLQLLNHIEKIQVNTDSRFVIRGLMQWIHFWKLNDWHTARGLKVKFARYWQQIDKLSEGKLLELKWIKAHSGNLNHDFCHQMAKQIATMQ